MQVEITVNGKQRSDDVEPRLLLVHYLREVCGLRAANVGCDTTSCGAWTVSTVQDFTDVPPPTSPGPFISTVQAPHEVVSHPTLAARRPHTSRR